MNKLDISDKKTKIYLNIDQDIIVSDAKDLRLRLIDFRDKIHKTRAWITSASICITILIALVTATFKDFVGIPAHIWEALFIFSCVITACMAVWQFCSFIIMRQKCSVDHFIEEVKKASTETNN